MSKMHFKIDTLSLLLLVLVAYCHGQLKTTEDCPTVDRPPKIIDRDTIYTYETNVNRLQLECLASYPIEWDVHGREMYTVIKQHITTKGNILKDPVKCFNSTIIVYQSESEHVTYSRTGNYTCQSMRNKEISTSIYKFVHAADHNLFAYPASESDYYSERIEVKEYFVVHNDEFVIPCRSNVENVNASLTKIETPKLLKLSGNDFIRYDPKIGFLINVAKFPFKPIGDYECELEFNSEKRTALIHLEPYHAITLPQYEVTPATEYVPINDIAHSVSLICKANEEVYIATSNPETFQLFKNQSQKGSFVIKEFNPAIRLEKQQIFQYEASAKVTPKPLSTGQIFCKTVANDSIVHTWNYNLWLSCDCTWNASLVIGNLQMGDAAWESIWQAVYPDLKGSIECKTRQQQKLHQSAIVSFHSCQNPTECKNSVFCPSEQRFCKSNNFHDTDTIELHNTVFLKQLHSGVIECSVQGYGHRFHAYADLNTIGFREDEVKTHINITESEQFVLKSDPQIFKCEVALYHLTGDLKWAFQFKNKSFGFFEKELQRVIQKGVGDKLISTITLEIKNSDVEFLYCFAPVWNSVTNEWKNSSVRLSVEDPHAEAYTESMFTSQKCLEQKKSENNVPSIIMERYTETVTSNFTTFWKSTEREFILRKRKLKKIISLICQAKYPVEWTFEGRKINAGFKLVENSMGKTEKDKMMCFESKIAIYDTVNGRSSRSIGLQGLTGKYICQSNHDKSLKSSTYIYRHYNTSFPLINHGHHEKLEIGNEKRKGEMWSLFPCRVTHPNVDVKLYMYNDNKYTELAIGKKVRYDPTRGFSVQNSLLDFAGHYFCSTKVKDESHSISFSIVEKLQHDITPSRINQDSSNGTNTKRCKGNRSNRSSKFLVVSITAAVLLVALVVVILLLFREIINQKKIIRDMNNGSLSVSYTQRLRETNPAFMEEIHIPEHNVRPSSNYERF